VQALENYSLQLFQGLVLFQCTGQCYGSSGSESVVLEAAVWYKIVV